MNDSDFDYVDDPTVAMRDDGSVAVAWSANQRMDVFFQLYAAEGRPLLPAPVNVSRSPTTFSWLPRVVLSGEQAFILWQEILVTRAHANVSRGAKFGFRARSEHSTTQNRVPECSGRFGASRARRSARAES